MSQPGIETDFVNNGCRGLLALTADRGHDEDVSALLQMDVPAINKQDLQERKALSWLYFEAIRQW